MALPWLLGSRPALGLMCAIAATTCPFRYCTFGSRWADECSRCRCLAVVPREVPTLHGRCCDGAASRAARTFAPSLAMCRVAPRRAAGCRAIARARGYACGETRRFVLVATAAELARGSPRRLVLDTRVGLACGEPRRCTGKPRRCTGKPRRCMLTARAKLACPAVRKGGGWLQRVILIRCWRCGACARRCPACHAWFARPALTATAVPHATICIRDTAPCAAFLDAGVPLEPRVARCWRGWRGPWRQWHRRWRCRRRWWRVAQNTALALAAQAV